MKYHYSKQKTMKPLIITGTDLKIEDVVNVARHLQKVELHPEAKNRINACRAMLERKIDWQNPFGDDLLERFFGDRPVKGM